MGRREEGRGEEGEERRGRRVGERGERREKGKKIRKIEKEKGREKGLKERGKRVPTILRVYAPPTLSLCEK